MTFPVFLFHFSWATFCFCCCHRFWFICSRTMEISWIQEFMWFGCCWSLSDSVQRIFTRHSVWLGNCWMKWPYCGSALQPSQCFIRWNFFHVASKAIGRSLLSSRVTGLVRNSLLIPHLKFLFQQNFCHMHWHQRDYLHSAHHLAASHKCFCFDVACHSGVWFVVFRAERVSEMPLHRVWEMSSHRTFSLFQGDVLASLSLGNPHCRRACFGHFVLGRRSVLLWLLAGREIPVFTCDVAHLDFHILLHGNGAIRLLCRQRGVQESNSRSQVLASQWFRVWDPVCFHQMLLYGGPGAHLRDLLGSCGEDWIELDSKESSIIKH